MKLSTIAALIYFMCCGQLANAESAVFWVSGPVRPSEAVLATGYFPQPQQISLKVANIGHTAGDWRSLIFTNGVRVTPLKVTESSIVFVLPDLGGDGVYGFRLDQPHEPPVYARVNLPEVWWTMGESAGANPENPRRVDVESAAAGAQLRLFGRCLTYGGVAASVRLTSPTGKIVNLKSTNEGSYELSATLPGGLAPGKYSLEVRPREGNNAVASSARVIQVHAADEAHLASLNLADFGAKGDSHFDNTPAFDSRSLQSRRAGRGGNRNPRRRVLSVASPEDSPSCVSRGRVPQSDRSLFSRL